MKTLRTPDERFENLPGFDFAPHYVEVNGLRMHYLDEGTGDPILCLHGEPSWCYLYRKMVPILALEHRVVAPDLVGFGRSDKPAERSAYTYAMHHDAVVGFIEALDLRRITLVCQDWGGLLGLPIATEMPDRFARLVIMNTGLPTGDPPQTEAAKKSAAAFAAWRGFAERTLDLPIGFVIKGATKSNPSAEILAAYEAPYPDATYKAGAAQFPLLVPVAPGDEAVPAMKRTREALRQWTKPALVMFSDSDPITAGGDEFFRRTIPSAKDEPAVTIRDAAHFLQEDKGEEIADHIRQFLARRPVTG
ncbi:MAG TPA: haloalkane dehalogenase [Pirellulales bacterium]|jgi:haloalkane dehalogenase